MANGCDLSPVNDMPAMQLVTHSLSYNHSDNDVVAKGNRDDLRADEPRNDSRQYVASNQYRLSQSQNGQGLRHVETPYRVPKLSVPDNTFLGHRRNRSEDYKKGPRLIQSQYTGHNFSSPQPSPRYHKLNAEGMTGSFSSPNFTQPPPRHGAPAHSISFDTSDYRCFDQHGYPSTQRNYYPYMCHNVQQRNDPAREHFTMENYHGQTSNFSNHYDNSSENVWCLHFWQQNESFLRLQVAIDRAGAVQNDLEKHVRELDNELNQLLKSNPTERQYLQLKEENNALEVQLQKMISELDSMGVAIPSCTPNDSSHNPPIKPKPPRGRQSRISYLPIDLSSAYVPIETFRQLRSDPIAENQSQPQRHRKEAAITTEPPAYPTIHDPTPRYVNCVPPPPPAVDSPPPLLPRVATNHAPFPPPDVDEKWICPKCTFKNLAILNCEMCDVPRPLVRR